MAKLDETLAILHEARERSKSTFVAFSGGKDSLAVMDMACRCFDEVVGLFKFLVPGLACVDAMLAAATARWGVKFLQYPSQNMVRAFKEGLFCDARLKNDNLPDITSWAIYAAAIRDAKIPMVLTGMRRADSHSRRRLLKWTSANRQVLHPIAGWQKIDVVSYLRVQGIPIPSSSGEQTSGIELVASELLWLHDEHPADFAKVRRYFPYVDAVIHQRQFYGTSQQRKAKTA